MGDPIHLDNTDTRYSDDFLRDALLRMVQSSCDVVLVITDTALVSGSEIMVPGLAAPEAQVAVIFTRKLLTVPAGEQIRSLETTAVRWNAATLFYTLWGTCWGLNIRIKS